MADDARAVRLVFFVCLSLAARAEELYKVGVVYDPKFTKIEELYNLTAKLWNGDNHRLTYIPVDASGNDVHTSLCAQVKSQSLQALLSYPRDEAVAQGTKAVALAAGIPTMQVYPGLWNVDTAGGTSAQGNYVEVVPTNLVMDAFFPEFLNKATVKTYGVLSDGFYESDIQLMAALAKASGQATLVTQLTYNKSTTPSALMSELTRQAVKDVVMVMTTKSAEAFFLVAEASVTSQFRFVLFTPDARPFTCSACDIVQLLWVRPNHFVRGATGNPMDDPKEYINFEYERYDVLNMETEVGLGFYFGLLRITEAYLAKLNETSLPEFECGSAPSLSETLLNFVVRIFLNQ